MMTSSWGTDGRSDTEKSWLMSSNYMIIIISDERDVFFNDWQAFFNKADTKNGKTS